DQRGYTRTVGAGTDIGAYEFGATAAKAPTVVGVVINGGAAQRSMVTTVKVTFSEAVSFPSGINAAFQLSRIANPSAGPEAGAPLGLVNVKAVQPGAGVTLTFVNGGAVGVDPGGSLLDGTYKLAIVAAKVQGAGGALDGNGDGTGGDDYATPTTGASRIFR